MTTRDHAVSGSTLGTMSEETPKARAGRKREVTAIDGRLPADVIRALAEDEQREQQAADDEASESS